MTTLNNFNDLELVDLADVSLVMWDMDGTLVSTERIHAMATHSLLLEKDLSVEELEKSTCGQADDYVYEKLSHNMSFDNKEEYILKKNEIIKELIVENKSSIISPKIISFIKLLQSKEIAIALVTSSQREVMNIILEALDLNKYFHNKRCFEDNNFNKPDPQPYLNTLTELEIEADKAIIFEDSQVGLMAANASKVKKVYQVKWY